MRRLALALALLALPAHAATLPVWAPANVVDPVGYTLAFDDEFDSADVACFYWGQFAGAHNWYTLANEQGSPANPCSRTTGSQATVAGGMAKITLANVGGRWVTANMRTMAPSREGKAFTKARFVARIKLPSAIPAGIDVWPAFWVLGRWTGPALVPSAAYTAPTSDYAYSEVDVMEGWPSNGANLLSTHQWPASPPDAAMPVSLHQTLTTTLKPFDDKWHVYGLNVDPDGEVCADFDGVQQGCMPASALDLSHPLYAILSLDARSIAATTDPAATYSMYVDYVRIYAPAQ